MTEGYHVKGIFTTLFITISLAVKAQNVQRFCPSDVHLTSSEMLQRQLWDEHYILSLNADRLLYHFRGEYDTSDGMIMIFRPLYEIHDCRFADYLKTN